MFKEPQPLDRKIYDVSQGMARSFTRKVFDESGYAITGFNGAETFTVEIATGLPGSPTYEEPTASWTIPTDGEYQILIPELDLKIGIYSLRVVLNPNGQTCYPSPREVFRGFLRVNAAPQTGSSDCLKVYCDYGDLLEKAPYLENTHTDNDLSGFSRQRYRAKLWVDSCILRASSNTNFYGLQAINYGVVSPNSYGSRYVAQLLDQNKLIVNMPIRDAAAHYSLYLITNALSSTPTTGSYQEISQKHFSLANSMMQSMVALFDTNGSGQAGYAVDLRIADGRTTA
jgi:hypothetical protein